MKGTQMFGRTRPAPSEASGRAYKHLSRFASKSESLVVLWAPAEKKISGLLDGIRRSGDAKIQPHIERPTCPASSSTQNCRRTGSG